MPVNQLRTMAWDGPTSSRKCLSAVARSDLPGPPPKKGHSICSKVSALLPNVTIPFFGPEKAGPVTITLHNLTLILPAIDLNNFSICGFYDSGPGGLAEGRGTLNWELGIPKVPFHIEQFHFELPPAHGSGVINGWAQAHVKIALDYDLKKPRLSCDNFTLALGHLEMKIHGGGGWHSLLATLTKAIESIVRKLIPSTIDPEVCPAINKLALRVNECGDAAKLGPVALLLCIISGKPPVCKEAPCFACDDSTHTCKQVDPGTNRSTDNKHDCDLSCAAPPPPPAPCVPDGHCATSSLEHGCCSKRLHRTVKCKYGRCGCIRKGECSDSKNDCCSKKGHKTAACSAGIGYRCD